MNDLLVTKETFAKITCMDGMAFGVNTFCNPCEFYLRSCQRRHLGHSLVPAQQLVEQKLGYSLMTEYHYQEFLWNGTDRLQLPLDTIAINVKEKITKIGGSYTVSPFVLENISTQIIDSQTVYVLDKNYVDNPGSVTLRDVDTDNPVIPLSIAGYPKRDSFRNWLIPVEDDSPDVNVQHCKYMFASIPTPACGGTFHAVYPGTTDEIIPFGKSSTVIGGNTLYWFYTWSLVDHDFAEDDRIDLVAGEFYKLLSSVEFICSEDQVAAPIVVNVTPYWLRHPVTPATPTLNIVMTKTLDHSVSGEARYSISVHNAETVTSGINVMVSDLLPASASILSYVISDGSYDPASDDWSVGQLDAGDTATIVIRASLSPNTTVSPAVLSYAIPPSVPANVLTTTVEDVLTAEMIFDGIALVGITNRNCSCFRQQTIKIGLYYKTSPAKLGINLDDIAEGIVYLVAAELPMQECECSKPEAGFIAEAMKPYDNIKINPITGVTYDVLTYGTLHGQMVFNERLSKAPRMAKVIVI